MEYLSKKWTQWSEVGLHFPFAYDAPNKKPSITLFFAIITFFIAAASVISMHFVKGMLEPALTAIGFWAVSMVFYLMRQITKANFNLQQRSFSVENDASDKPSPKSEA